MAIAGIVLLVAIYASTMVFALMKNPIADRLLMASVFCTVAVPVILYGMLLVARNLEQRGEELQREADHQHRKAADPMPEEDTAKKKGDC